MRIACPGCAAEYDVPDTLLAAGPRPLRCARCGTEFRAELPPAEPFVAAAEPAAVPVAAAASAAPPPPPGSEPVVAPPEPPSAMPERGPAQAVAAPEDEAAQEAPRPLPSRARQHAPIYPPLPRREEQEAAAERGVALAGWAGSLILLATAVWLVYAWRAEIIELWPPAARLFIALGLA
jgi:predicted Zn finger-like uncharacterized protein